MSGTRHRKQDGSVTSYIKLLTRGLTTQPTLTSLVLIKGVKNRERIYFKVKI